MAGGFAGFKFRRQHAVGDHILFLRRRKTGRGTGRLAARPSLMGMHRDAEREKYLVEQGIATLRFWNSQWRKNREGCLLEIWNAEGKIGLGARDEERRRSKDSFRQFDRSRSVSRIRAA